MKVSTKTYSCQVAKVLRFWVDSFIYRDLTYDCGMKKNGSLPATKNGFQGIKEILRGMEGRLEVKMVFAIERAEQRIDEKARTYRDEILNVFDKYLGEIKTARDDREVISTRVYEHEDRITVLEKTVFPAKESPA